MSFLQIPGLPDFSFGFSAPSRPATDVAWLPDRADAVLPSESVVVPLGGDQPSSPASGAMLLQNSAALVP